MPGREMVIFRKILFPKVIRKLQVCLVFFFFLLFSAKAQQAGDLLPLTNVNLSFLESLVKTGIDSVRQAHGLTILRNDSILFVAAKYHADYLDTLQDISHFEKNRPDKYAPVDRVHYFGGTDYSVGENVLCTYSYTELTDKHDPPGTPPHENRTYEELAHDMVMIWVHSPPHYKNMLTPAYEFTGLAVAYDPAKKCFYGVQVFGSLPYYKADTAFHAFFPYDTIRPKIINSFENVSHIPHSEIHAWGLKDPLDSAKTCTSCWGDDFRTGGTTLNVKNGNIIFETKDVELIKQLIDNKKDGFVAEIVTYKPFDCGNPQYYEKASRRNGQCIYNGKILKPKYRKQLKHGFKKKTRHHLLQRIRLAHEKTAGKNGFRSKWKTWHAEMKYPFDAETYSVSLGKIPKDIEGYYELNVLLIQKKQVCRVMHFTDFCGNDWMINPVFIEPLDLPDDTLAFENKKRTYNFTVPFEQSNYNYKQKDIQPFLDSLQFTRFKITSATVSAFASVEGSEALNKKLQEQRANSIISAMQASVADSFAFSVVTDENWAIFEKQLKSVPAFSIFKGKSHEEIKKLLEDTNLVNKLDPWLSKQRYAKITLQLDVFIYPDSDWAWVKPTNDRWTDSLVKTKNKRFLDSLDRLQNFYFGLARSGKIDTTLLREFQWPAGTLFDTLAYNHAWLLKDIRAYKDSAANDKAFYGACVRRINANKEKPYWPAVFGMLNEYMKYWEADKTIDGSDPAIILEWIGVAKKISPDTIFKTLDSLEWKWNYNAVPYYETKGKKYENLAINAMAGIYHYWDIAGINDSIALRLCDYFIFHNQIDWALSILQPFALKENPDHKILMQYIRMSYRHVEEDGHFDEYYALIKKASGYLTHDEWCSMFVGPCNISFQVFDSEKLRNDYCEECAGWKNYARDPSQWRLEKK